MKIIKTEEDIVKFMYYNGVAPLFNSLVNGNTVSLVTKKNKLIAQGKIIFKENNFCVKAENISLHCLNNGKADKLYIVTNDNKFCLEIGIESNEHVFNCYINEKDYRKNDIFTIDDVCLTM